LHDRAFPYGGDRLRQAFQPVADRDALVGDAAVLQLGEHGQPDLRTLPAVTGPQPEDVAFTGHGDPDDHVDGSVGDLPVADTQPRPTTFDDRSAIGGSCRAAVGREAAGQQE
jgi:hypothetical protein